MIVVQVSRMKKRAPGGGGGPHLGSAGGGSSSGPGDFYIPLCKESFSFKVPTDDPDIRVAKMWGPNTLDGLPYPYYCNNVSIIEIPRSLGADPNIQFTANQARWLAARSLTNVLRDLVTDDLDLRNCTATRNTIAARWQIELRREAAKEKTYQNRNRSKAI